MFVLKLKFNNVFEAYMYNLNCTNLLFVSSEFLGFDNVEFTQQVCEAKPDSCGRYHIAGNCLTESDYKSLFIRVPSSYTKDYGILSYDGLMLIENLYNDNKLSRDCDLKGFTENYSILKKQLFVIDADYRRYLYCLSNQDAICLEDCKKYHQFFYEDLAEVSCNIDYLEIYYLHQMKELCDVKTVGAGNYLIGKARLLDTGFCYVEKKEDDEKEYLVYSELKDYKFVEAWFILNKLTGDITDLNEFDLYYCCKRG